MQKQWGLYLGAVLFFIVALALLYVAGPDSYPQSTSGGRVARSIPRDTYITNQLIGLGVSIVFVAIAVPLSGRYFGRRVKPAVRAYWTEHPARYRHLTAAWILNTATVGTIGYGLILLLHAAFPGVSSTLFGVVHLAAIGVTIVRGALPIARPKIPDVSGAAPVDSSGRSASPGS